MCDIEARDIARYQQKRIDEGCVPENCQPGNRNSAGDLEALRPLGASTAQCEMLTTREDVGRAVSTEEEAALLQACGRSRSRSLVPFVTLAIETGARYRRYSDAAMGQRGF